MQTRSCDISVIGAGSGGFAAAVAASRNRASVLRIEAAEGVGETYTWAGANNYEPAALDQIMRQILATEDRCRLHVQSRFTAVESNGRRISALLAEGPEGGRNHRRALRRQYIEHLPCNPALSPATRWRGLDRASGYLDAMTDITPPPEQDFTPGQPYEIN